MDIESSRSDQQIIQDNLHGNADHHRDHWDPLFSETLQDTARRLDNREKYDRHCGECQKIGCKLDFWSVKTLS